MLLISDSNIIIDMEAGGLLEAMFGLDDEFAVPDVLFAEELEPTYPQLRTLGLKIYELSDKSVEYMIQLQATYGSLGTNDLLAWALARQEECPLLTGDRRLCQSAREAGVEVRGTLWLMQRMKDERLITPTEAAGAYRKMRQAGSRLPWNEVE
jgi:predicted nucleic acid-binding protein